MFFLNVFLNVSSRGEDLKTNQNCKTLDGGGLCIFPFVFRGIKYFGCVDKNDNNDKNDTYDTNDKNDRNGRFKCATEVEEHSGEVLQWETCHENCPKQKEPIVIVETLEGEVRKSRSVLVNLNVKLE